MLTYIIGSVTVEPGEDRPENTGVKMVPRTKSYTNRFGLFRDWG